MFSVKVEKETDIFSNAPSIPEKLKVRAVALIKLAKDNKFTSRELLSLLEANNQNPDALNFMDGLLVSETASAKTLLIWYLQEFLARSKASTSGCADNVISPSPLPTLDVRTKLQELHMDASPAFSTPKNTSNKSHRILLQDGIRQIYGKPSSSITANDFFDVEETLKSDITPVILGKYFSLDSYMPVQ